MIRFELVFIDVNEIKTVLFLEPTHQGAQQLDKTLSARV